MAGKGRWTGHMRVQQRVGNRPRVCRTDLLEADLISVLMRSSFRARFHTESYGRWPLHARRGTGLSQAINRQVALVGSGLVWWQLLS